MAPIAQILAKVVFDLIGADGDGADSWPAASLSELGARHGARRLRHGRHTPHGLHPIGNSDAPSEMNKLGRAQPLALSSALEEIDLRHRQCVPIDA
jgi:hypothetical protein